MSQPTQPPPFASFVPRSSPGRAPAESRREHDLRLALNAQERALIESEAADRGTPIATIVRDALRLYFAGRSNKGAP